MGCIWRLRFHSFRGMAMETERSPSSIGDLMTIQMPKKKNSHVIIGKSYLLRATVADQ